jgi:hypothetical protein
MQQVNPEQQKPSESARAERAERRADLLVRMLQGTMGLEGRRSPRPFSSVSRSRRSRNCSSDEWLRIDPG